MMFNCGKEINSRKGSGIVEIVNEAGKRSHGDELMFIYLDVG